MKRRNWMIPAAVLVLAAVLIAYGWDREEPMYGDDEDAILESLQSLDMFGNQVLSVLEIRDFGGIRVVPLLAGQEPGYAVFERDEDGRYVWKHASKQGGSDFATFLVTDVPRVMLLVMNGRNEIAKLQVDVNGQAAEQSFPAHEPGAAWLELPDNPDQEGNYTFRSYRYYDAEGNLLENR